MHILQVIPVLSHGGAEHFVIELSNELVKQGHKCEIVSLYTLVKENEIVHSLDKKVKLSSLNKKKGLDYRCMIKLYHYINNGNFDVVHVHVGAIPYILWSTIKLKKVRFVATIHSEAKREAGSHLMKLVRVFMFKKHKCIPVTISEESKSSFVDLYHMDAPMVYNGVAPYHQTHDVQVKDHEDQLIFMHPASCREVKNQKLLFEAFTKLVKDYPNVKLLWFAELDSSEYRKSLDKYLGGHIQCLGTVANLRDYLAQADAMCLSSLMEGMPMTIIEAFSVGCPSLCTPVGGIINMIEDGMNGMLSKDLTLDNYYQMLLQFCKLSYSQRAILKENAKKSFERYTIQQTAKEYLQIYSARIVNL